jgi:hypothetical protein
MTKEKDEQKYLEWRIARTFFIIIYTVGVIVGIVICKFLQF